MFKMNKKLSKIFIGLSLLVSFVLPLAVRGAMNAIAWEENLDAGFIYQDSNSNEFICYPLEGTNGVSIGWAHENVNTPTHLDIPSSVSDGSVVYPVKAIATSGFHGCNFETVNIPQTVEEIKPEAFLTCTNLQLIQLPYLLTEIEKSTFMDCRSLMRVSYSDSEGNSTMNNNRITRIGDHAFASCVSLFVFSVPTSILRFEHSAFQGCKSLTSFFFPANPIVIEKYAFSDCEKLTLVYIDKNIQNIENFAFSDCNGSLTFYTNATADFVFNGSTNFWRYRYLAYTKKSDVYKVVLKQSQLLNDVDYPDLIYQVNSSATQINSVCNSGYHLTAGKERYATVFGYTCYELNSPNLTVDGYLTLPDKVKGVDGKLYNLQVLNSRCFANHEELVGVSFNENLVQIKEYAFENSLNIETFNFDNCLRLKEIGKYAFGTSDKEDKENRVCKGFRFPNSLEILCDHSIRNFTNANSLSFKTDENSCSHLRHIGDSAFRRFGYRVDPSECTCDVLLPCSLSDNVSCTNIRKNDSCVSIYNNAFNEANSLRDVTMETCSHNVADHISDDISFGEKVFYSCANLRNFTANERFYKAKILFYNCPKLQDIKLYADRAWNRTTDSRNKAVPSNPWGDNDWRADNKSWFYESPDAIIYIKGDLGAGKTSLFNHERSKSGSYNLSSPMFVEKQADAQYNALRNEISRSFVPTYDNCDWDNGELEQYTVSGGTLSVIKSGSGSSTFGTVTRYRGVANGHSIDISNVTSYPIKVIGESAFAQAEDINLHETIILPDSIEEIRERAFYQPYLCDGDFKGGTHLKVVTYRVNGNLQTPSNNSYSGNYCILPDSVKYIGNYAFYSNEFKYVKFGALDYYGIDMFTVLPKGGNTPVYNSLIEEFDVTDSSKVSYINGGFYYVADANRKTLLYQIQNNQNTQLTLDSGTKAIANAALAGSNITKLTLPSGFTNIYPLGLAGCMSLTEINGPGLSTIEHLGFESDDLDDYWINDIPTSNYTFDNFRISAFGCFKTCRNLANFDLTKLVNLRTIGPFCFAENVKLQNMTNSVKHVFYKTTNGVLNSKAYYDDYKKVMDLTNSTKLRRIGRGAFRRFTGTKYFIFPNSTNYDGTQESKMKFYYNGYLDTATKMFDGVSGATIMIGETAFQAYENNNRLNAASHYEKGFLGSTAPYYFANSSSDLDLDHSSLKYWTFYGGSKETRKYVLFDKLAEARAYFNLLEQA